MEIRTDYSDIEIIESTIHLLLSGNATIDMLDIATIRRFLSQDTVTVPGWWIPYMPTIVAVLSEAISDVPVMGTFEEIVGANSDFQMIMEIVFTDDIRSINMAVLASIISKADLAIPTELMYLKPFITRRLVEIAMQLGLLD